MKLIWKGKFNSIADLAPADLPAHAVRFKEPDSLAGIAKASLPFHMPPLLLWFALVALKAMIHGSVVILHPLGLVLTLLCILPHELLHAAAFPKEARVEIWHSLRNGMAFVYSTAPVSKGRFIYISLLPNLVLGVLPLAVWLFLPPDQLWTGILSTHAFFILPLGAGDYLNVRNAARQAPKGATLQLSGLNTYWYPTKPA